MRISVCVPARNEAPTIAAVVAAAVQREIVDEVVVIDDGSTDDTAELAAAAGARVEHEADVLPEAGPGAGKGNALWKGLYACDGDVICFLDADSERFGAHLEQLPFATGYAQPLRDLGPMASAVLHAVAVRLEREGRLRGPLPATFTPSGVDAPPAQVSEPVERPPLRSLRAAA